MKIFSEHEKLKNLGGANQIVGNFIEWLNEKGWQICGEDTTERGYFPIYKSTNELISEHFEIDSLKLDQEKQIMLDDLRSQQP